MADGNKTFMVEDGTLIYRNFSGRETPFNREGDRNFSVILEENMAKELEKDGWNVKYKDPREDDEDGEGFWHIGIAVGFKFKPPRIVVITDTGRTFLDETTVSTLDWADIRTADLIARPYEWAVGGKSGIKAYLQSLFVTIEEDALEAKYGINRGAEFEGPQQ